MSSRRSIYVCTRCLQTRSLQRSHPASRAFSSAAVRRARTAEESTEQQPRWKQTPAAMTMPFRLRPQPNQPAWKVNDRQEPLDEMYDRFLGRKFQGRDALPEEIKWLAVTHKSFDHARQGFNDRLAFLGKRLVDLQTSTALLNMPGVHATAPAPENEVYQHPALEGLENVTHFTKTSVLDRHRLAGLAASYGVDKVVRWKPKRSDNLKASGLDTVLAHTMYSIIGALALQKGGEVAARVTRERILQPLGLR